jgi:PLP dependent protein
VILLLKVAFLYKNTKYMLNTIAKNIQKINDELSNAGAKLIAVTKTKPISDLMQAYDSGFKRYGENKVQDLVEKYEAMPKDIEWHMIGHLQSNKVKYIAPFVSLIHSVDSVKLLEEINKQGAKNQRVIPCLLQIYIAKEDTKFGLSYSEAIELIESETFKEMKNIEIVGLMGMASNVADNEIVRAEFAGLKLFFDELKAKYNMPNFKLSEISMGMSGDYPIAVEEGSTLIRVGSAIFGNRDYSNNAQN